VKEASSDDKEEEKEKTEGIEKENSSKDVDTGIKDLLKGKNKEKEEKEEKEKEYQETEEERTKRLQDALSWYEKAAELGHVHARLKIKRWNTARDNKNKELAKLKNNNLSIKEFTIIDILKEQQDNINQFMKEIINEEPTMSTANSNASLNNGSSNTNTNNNNSNSGNNSSINSPSYSGHKYNKGSSSLYNNEMNSKGIFL